MYFCFNLSLTLYNKGVLVSFPFPYTLSALHALFGTLGGALLAQRGSWLYAINIVVSNVSLQLVTVPFHQVVRAATPIFTIFFSGLLFGAPSSHSKKMSLIPVVAGVGLAYAAFRFPSLLSAILIFFPHTTNSTFGDYYFSYAGFLLTLLGTVLAALKTIFTTSSRRRPPRPAPRARTSATRSTCSSCSPRSRSCSAVLLAHVTGELRAALRAAELSAGTLGALLLNGCLAFGLKVVSFSANRRVGALGMTVAANVKQVLTIVCAVVIFKLTITTLNAVGILLTLVGRRVVCVDRAGGEAGVNGGGGIDTNTHTRTYDVYDIRYTICDIRHTTCYTTLATEKT
ncbi:hypothetical protein B0H14DRAFT_3118363 [Mycena olivaceomarginata]|nr:hypothetical protein B0H14DRAFT_3118363 [Mycena olivaceomarginata]